MQRRRLLSLVELGCSMLIAASGALWLRDSRMGSPTRLAYGVMGLAQVLFAIILAISALVYSAFFARWTAFVYTFFGKGLLLFLAAAMAVRDQSATSMGLAVPLALIAGLYVALTIVSSTSAPVPLLYSGPLMAASRAPAPVSWAGTSLPTTGGPDNFALPPARPKEAGPSARVRSMDEAWAVEPETPMQHHGPGLVGSAGQPSRELHTDDTEIDLQHV